MLRSQQLDLDSSDALAVAMNSAMVGDSPKVPKTLIGLYSRSGQRLLTPNNQKAHGKQRCVEGIQKSV